MAQKPTKGDKNTGKKSTNGLDTFKSEPEERGSSEPTDDGGSGSKGPLSLAQALAPISLSPRQMTLWDYLVLQLTAVNSDLLNDTSAEGLLNIVKTPAQLEKVMLFGVLICLDTFLSIFTILPLRLCVAAYKLISGNLKSITRRGDLVKGTVLVAVLCAMAQLDISRIYHNIRGQAVIKLYVMFNVLEVADKLCSAIGQDITEFALSFATLSSPIRTVGAALLMLVYTAIHSSVVLYHVITLNVAVNSYSNALLTLLLSNQFSEIKSSVFKKFDRENLFQLTCADITERFQLLVTLLVVGARNIVEVSDSGTIPSSWNGWNRWLGALLGPAVAVVGSEIVVDSLKHAYVVKFNGIRPEVYKRFLDVLCSDYTTNAYTPEKIVAKRTGLSVFPLAIVSFLVLMQSYGLMTKRSMERELPSVPTVDTLIDKLFSGHSLSMLAVGGALFSALLLIKLVFGMLLLQYASKRRPSGHLTASFRDASAYKQAKESSSVELTTVSRFKMVAKRIW